jgi:hypothetical protein
MTIPQNRQAAFSTLFLQAQSRIRVVIDDAGNFGNQASSYNLMQRIRQMGFRGLFEVVYFGEVKDKILQLFDLPVMDANIFYTEEHRSIFIERDTFLDAVQAGQMQPIALGVTGATDPLPSKWNENMRDENFANVLNVDVFVRFSPYYNMDELCDTEIYQRDVNEPTIQKFSCQNMLITPIANFASAKHYLYHHPMGQQTLQDYPALDTLITRINDESINFQSLYGWTFREAPANLLNMILGAAYAQSYGVAELHKPLIIGAFFDFMQLNTYEEAIGKAISNIQILRNLIWNDDWERHNMAPGAAEVKKSIQELKLRQRLRIVTLGDPDAARMIATVKPHEILLISIPKLTKRLFDGFFTHHGKNILPPGREGAATLTSLLSVTGRPHIHCRSRYEWEINFNLATPSLQYALEQFNDYICPQDYYADLNFKPWKKAPLDEAIGKFIMASQDTTSPLSVFFARLKEHVLQPANDRILQDLYEATQLIEKRKKHLRKQKLSKPHEGSTAPSFWTVLTNNIHASISRVLSYLPDWTQERNAATAPAKVPAVATPKFSNASLIQRWLHASQSSNASLFDYVLNSTVNFAHDIVDNCPCYFPPAQLGSTPHYWNQQPSDAALIAHPFSIAPMNHFQQISMR